MTSSQEYYKSAAYKRAYYRRNVDRWREYKIAYNMQNPHKVLYYSAKGRAKRKGIPFSITMKDIVIPEVCPVLGIPLLVRGEVGGSRAVKWDAPSLDRIDPSIGYVPGNVRVISWRANSLKRDGTLAEMRLILADLERLQDR